MTQTNFKMVSAMNEAFGNAKGDPLNLDWQRIRSQCKNIGHEFVELLQALGLDPACVENIAGAIERNANPEQFNGDPNLLKARDALCDVNVFSYGAHHLMGIDADRDMNSVVTGVMSRFVKNEADLKATIAKHTAKGVTAYTFHGEYPTFVVKSAYDQPDAPKGKFLKSASYKEPVFYDAANPNWCAGCNPDNCSGCADHCGEKIAKSVAGDAITSSVKGSQVHPDMALPSKVLTEDATAKINGTAGDQATC